MARFQKRPTARDLEDHFRSQANDLRTLVEKLWDLGDAADAIVDAIGNIADNGNVRQARARLAQAAIYCDFDLDIFYKLIELIQERADYNLSTAGEVSQ